MSLFNINTLAPILVAASSINKAAFQPKKRTTEESLKDLEADILKSGLVYPLVIDLNCGLIDGHRRFAILIKHGCTEVPCIVLDEDQAERFAAVNGTIRRMAGKDQQEIYLKNPNALTKTQRQKLKNTEKYFGPTVFRELVANEVSTTSLRAEVNRAKKFVEANYPVYPSQSPARWGQEMSKNKQLAVRAISMNEELSALGKAKKIVELVFM